jgi:hypothetical protein
MEIMQELNTCKLCGKSGEELSLYSAKHKTKGQIDVCKECWINLYKDNKMTSGSSSCSSGASSGAGSCSSCCSGCNL